MAYIQTSIGTMLGGVARCALGILAGIAALSGAHAAANGKIAWASLRDGNYEIYVMAPDGSGPVNLTRHPALDYTPSWSPDGTRIAFSSDRDGNQEIYTMKADGTDLVRLTSNPAFDYFPAWSPDGSRIAFTRDLSGTSALMVVNADGSGEATLTDGSFNDTQPSWSPDGSKLAFASDRDALYGPGTYLEVYSMNADGSGIRRLTFNDGGIDYYPAWSPDGTKIAFTTDRTANPQCYAFALVIWVMNADGSDPVDLSRDCRGDFGAAWAPDGTLIAFSSDRSGGPPYAYDIFTLPAAGGVATQLTTTHADLLPAWGAVPAAPPPIGPPTSKEQCRNGGWATFDNPAFKNQGQCTSHVANGKHG